MKKLFTLLLLVVATTGFAQNFLKGTVKDIMTTENMDLVTVSTKDLQHNTITNSEGAFQLSYPDGTQTIVFNYLGYGTLEVDLNNLPEGNIFYLEPKSLELEEVVVLNTPINEFVSELIKNSYNHLNAPFLLSTYYREFVKINDTYTKFSDGLIDYNVDKSRKKIESDVVVKQSRAFKLDTPESEAADMTSPLDLRKAISRDCNFGALGSIFDKKEFKKYSFIIKSQQDADGNDVQTIYYQPLAEVEEPLYAGSLSYDPNKKLILAMDLYMAPSHKKYSKLRNFIIVKARLDDIAYKCFFKATDNSYMLSYSCVYGDIYIKNKKRFDDHVIFKSDLIVTNFTNDLTSFNKKEKYRERGLYEAGTNYIDEFWKKNNSILLTSQEEEIIKSLQDTK
ncbi:carboxypeptidase-like regulatory domain-containing protein [Flavobacterium beibuense]|uniref:Cna_B_2 multi-domain protein n=1 Tax=Flavobacterium beibuense TaxID=657326 RepID=A0A444WF08_9FLAO|nr:carboxypeptidase-like regulatory domain-containing protein [Flavobacterium beibuense]RYJ44407.1 Cna_B_2 multi-domain protein [Flavobacterium beibuense]